MRNGPDRFESIEAHREGERPEMAWMEMSPREAMDGPRSCQSLPVEWWMVEVSRWAVLPESGVDALGDWGRPLPSPSLVTPPRNHVSSRSPAPLEACLVP